MRATIVLLLTLFAAAPPQTPRFAVSINTTVIDAIVVDAAGNALSGLTASDFALTVNGVARPISAFAEVQLASDASPAAALPDPSGAIVTNRGFDRGRLVVIVIDDSSPMSAGDALRVRPTAEAVVRSLTSDTLVAVVLTSTAAAMQGFTSDRARLLKAVAAARPRVTVLPGQMDARESYESTGINSASDGDTSLRFRVEAAPFYQQVTRTLRSVSESLRALPERQKTVLFISPGLPLDLSASGLGSGTDATGPTAISDDPNGVKQMILNETVDVIRAAAESRATINSVDPGGLRSSVSQANRDYLRGLSASTGGDAIVNINDPAGALDRLWRSTRTYYLLGFETPDKNATSPKIGITTTRRGATVRFRRTDLGKVATTAPTEPGIAGALHGLLPSTDIDLDVNLTSIVRSRDEGSALAVVAGVSLPVSAATAGQRDIVTMAVNAYDLRDQPVASRQVSARIGLPATPGALEFDLLCRLDLKPGRYRLRIGVASAVTGKAGNVFADLDVPDSASAPLLMSSVMLSAPGRAASPLDAFQGLLTAVPTNRRKFATGTNVNAATSLFQGARRPVALTVSTRVVRDDGAEVFGRTETVAADRFAASRSLLYDTDLPTATMAPGVYVVEFTARGSGVPSVTQQTRFIVRPR